MVVPEFFNRRSKIFLMTVPSGPKGFQLSSKLLYSSQAIDCIDSHKFYDAPSLVRGLCVNNPFFCDTHSLEICWHQFPVKPHNIRQHTNRFLALKPARELDYNSRSDEHPMHPFRSLQSCVHVKTSLPAGNPGTGFWEWDSGNGSPGMGFQKRDSENGIQGKEFWEQNSGILAGIHNPIPATSHPESYHPSA